MTISIKQDNLTVAVELEEDGFVIGRVYSDKAVVKAYYRTDPDGMTERDDSDPVLKMCPY